MIYQLRQISRLDKHMQGYKVLTSRVR